MTRFEVQPGDYPPFHREYVSLTQDREIVALLQAQKHVFLQLIGSLPQSRGDETYAPGKWTIKQVIQHIIDAERVFAFRLLAMSRGEQQNIRGFDQDKYLAHVDVQARTLADQYREFETVRDATLSLMYSLSQAEADRVGRVSDHPLAARAVPYIIAGHLEHHLHVLRERYGVS